MRVPAVYLVAHSLGAWVAVAMAYQLTQACLQVFPEAHFETLPAAPSTLGLKQDAVRDAIDEMVCSETMGMASLGYHAQ